MKRHGASGLADKRRAMSRPPCSMDRSQSGAHRGAALSTDRTALSNALPKRRRRADDGRMDPDPPALGPPEANATSRSAGLIGAEALGGDRGAPYPVPGHVMPAGEEYDARAALDSVIFAGLLHP